MESQLMLQRLNDLQGRCVWLNRKKTEAYEMIRCFLDAWICSFVSLLLIWLFSPLFSYALVIETVHDEESAIITSVRIEYSVTIHDVYKISLNNIMESTFSWYDINSDDTMCAKDSFFFLILNKKISFVIFFCVAVISERCVVRVSCAWFSAGKPNCFR